MIKYTRALFSFMFTLGALAGACGQTDAGGGAGSETHWLSACDESADCRVGECLAGVCTVACRSVRDCPAPLDACLATSAADQTTCQSSDPGTSEQALEQLPPPTTRLFPTCDRGRAGEVRLTDVQFGYTEPGKAPATLVVADRPSGFLAFGGTDADFYRLAADGSLVRHLPAPSPRKPVIDDIAVLEDGSLLLAGGVERTGPNAEDRTWGGWVGKVDASWNLLWERDFDVAQLNFADVEPLPDGGALVAVLSVASELMPRAVRWARLSESGELLWERSASVPLVDFDSLASQGILTVTGQSARIVVSGQDGAVLLTSDLDGNSDQESLRVGTRLNVHDVQALPNGRWAVLYKDSVVLMNDAGPVVWTSGFEVGIELPRALTYDASRGELLVAGEAYDADSGGFGSWLAAIDLEGTRTWQLRRKPWDEVGPTKAADSAIYGSPLDNVAVDALGNILAAHPNPSLWLSSLWVGRKTCGE